MNMEEVIFSKDEINRINPELVHGELENMVQAEMKAFNVELDIWKSLYYEDNVRIFARDQGWLQEGFDEMQIVF